MRPNLTILLAAAALTAPATASADTADLAIVGDTPYGAQQIANFPNDIARINADPAVERVVHVGDIKNGSSLCTDAYFAQIRSAFDSFADPLVYTPGDNEWTDCHRTNNGSYDPLERLAKLRELFFPVAGQTLGQQPVAVESQGAPVLENVLWSQGGAQFGTVHVVGSNNSLDAWTGRSAPTPEQLAEVDDRTDAALKWINRIFARAHAERAAGVVVLMQADMWDPFATKGYNAIAKRIAQRAHEFGKPVLLIQGDSHDWTVDHPFTPGDANHGRYDTPVDAPNLTRVVVQGSTSCPHVYLRLHVDAASPAVFSGENVLLPLSGTCDSAPPLGGF